MAFLRRQAVQARTREAAAKQRWRAGEKQRQTAFREQARRKALAQGGPSCEEPIYEWRIEIDAGRKTKRYDAMPAACRDAITHRARRARIEGEPPKDTSRAPARSEPSRRSGVELYEAAQDAEERGDLETAVRDYEAAYAALKDGRILYFLARVCEAQGDRARAAEAYRRYLDEVPRAPSWHRAKIEKKLEELRRQ